MDQEPEPADHEDAVVPDPMKGHVVLDHVYFGYEPDKVIPVSYTHLDVYKRQILQGPDVKGHGTWNQVSGGQRLSCAGEPAGRAAGIPAGGLLLA